MLRGNADLVILQPIFNLDSRKELHNLYAGFMEYKLFEQLMDEVVFDENLPGSTPQEPIKRVRTMYINDYENTIDPSMKFKWYEAIDPGPFRMLHPLYWKEQDNSLEQSGAKGGGMHKDPVHELDSVQSTIDSKFSI
jgi:hypothetical protein